LTVADMENFQIPRLEAKRQFPEREKERERERARETEKKQRGAELGGALSQSQSFFALPWPPRTDSNVA